MKIMGKLSILLILLFSCCIVQAEQVQILFDCVGSVTPFEQVVQQCMKTQEHLTRVIQSGDRESLFPMFDQVLSLHAECVRMHDSRIEIPLEDMDYLENWFAHLSQQMNGINICPCMAIMLERSKSLIS